MKISIIMMYDPLTMLGGQIASAGLGLALQKGQDRRQLNQAGKMQELQIKGNKELTDYNAAKQLQMWKDTSYGAQKEQMKMAGINPALMYGMGGGGGQSSSVNAGSVSGGGGPSTGGEVQSGMGLGMAAIAQIQLLKAQKENIEADTENKRTETGYTGGPKTENTQADTRVKGKQEEAGELENRMKEYFQITDEKGRQVDGLQGSVAAQQGLAELRNNIANAMFREDENTRQNVMNNAQIQKMAQEIDLMKKKGMTEMQIFQNLQKDGTMKQTEIEWNKIGLKTETLSHLMIGLIKRAVK